MVHNRMAQAHKCNTKGISTLSSHKGRATNEITLSQIPMRVRHASGWAGVALSTGAPRSRIFEMRPVACKRAPVAISYNTEGAWTLSLHGGRSKSETFFSDSRDAETLLYRVGRLFGHHAVAFSKCSGSAPQAHKYNTEGI